MIVEGRGIALAVSLSGGGQHDSTLLIALLDAVPRVRGRGRGHPRGKPETVYADRVYGVSVCCRGLRWRGIRSKIAERGVVRGSGLGKVCCVVERTFAWLHGMRCLCTRYERRAGIHQAFLNVGICIIALRHVVRLC